MAESSRRWKDGKFREWKVVVECVIAIVERVVFEARSESSENRRRVIIAGTWSHYSFNLIDSTSYLQLLYLIVVIMLNSETPE